jgi:hypothetical protein
MRQELQVRRGLPDSIRQGNERGSVPGAPKPRLAGLAVALLAAGLLAGCATDGKRTSQSGFAAAAAEATETGPVPDQLIGAPAAQVLATLGQPEVQRHERPAEIWQYRGRDCVLDVFLYSAGKVGSLGAAAEAATVHTVVHVEARDARARAIEPGNCLTGVRSARLAS